MEPAGRDQGKSISNKSRCVENASSPRQEEQVSALGEPPAGGSAAGEAGERGIVEWGPDVAVSLGAGGTFLGTGVEQQAEKGCLQRRDGQ